MSLLICRIIVLTSASLFLTWSAIAGGSEITSGIEKERSDVQEVSSVSHAGVRYEAVLWGRARGLPQNGGYVAAIDEKTGIELWIEKIYDAVPTNGMEQDKSYVFITSLSLSPDKRHLRILNERGAEYQLDIKSRSVTHRSGARIAE